MKKRIIGILLVCVVLLVGCRKEQIKDVSQKETFTVTYNQKEKPVPYTKHYHLAGMNEEDFFILEDNGIYRLKGEEKEKIVEASGISYFADTDRYLYFFSSSAETDYEERLTIYDMQMKLKVEAAWEEEPCPIYGLDRYSLMYLIGELYRRTGSYENGSRWLGSVVTSSVASQKIKDKARDMRELCKKMM